MTPHMRIPYVIKQSLIAMMIAGLIERETGRMGPRDQSYPELSGSAFEKATIRQMFDQTTASN